MQTWSRSLQLKDNWRRLWFFHFSSVWKDALQKKAKTWSMMYPRIKHNLRLQEGWFCLDIKKSFQKMRAFQNEMKYYEKRWVPLHGMHSSSGSTIQVLMCWGCFNLNSCREMDFMASGDPWQFTTLSFICVMNLTSWIWVRRGMQHLHCKTSNKTLITA